MNSVNSTRSLALVHTAPQEISPDRKLFTPKQAVAVFEKGYIEHVKRKNAQASTGVREILKKNAVPIDSLDKLSVDDVLVVHRRPTENSDRIRHGMFVELETFDLEDEDALMTITEIASLQRSLAKPLLKLKQSFESNMGIWQSTDYRKTSQLEHFINKGELFKLNIDRSQLKVAIDNVLNKMKSSRKEPGYFSTFNCNNFVYDTLVEVNKIVNKGDDL